MKNILINVSKSLSTTLSLPFKIEKANILYIARGSSILHVVCSVPLMESQRNYDFYSVHSLELKMQNITSKAIFTRHKLDVKHFLISDDLASVSILNKYDFERCVHSPIHYCKWGTATLNTISVEKFCVLQVFLTDKMDLSICHIKIIKHSILYPSINNIASDFWIVQYINSIKLSTICHDGLEDYVNTKANFDILHIKKGCHCVSKFASLPENVNYAKDISLQVNIIKN